MKVPKIFSAIAAAAILFATSAGVDAAPKANFVEGVDWTNKVVTVIGEGVAPKDAVNYTQAKGMAAKAAQADAYRKLAEMINGVRVEGETTVEKMLTTQDTIKLRVSATIKGAKIIDETFLSDGGYRVVMQVPLFGVTNSLAGAVMEKNATIEPFPQPVADVAPTAPQYDSNTPVSRRIEITAQTKVTVEETVAPEQNFNNLPPTTYQSPLARKSVPSLDSIILNKLEANTLTVREVAYQAPVANSQIAYDTPQQTVKRTVADYASAAQGDYTGLIVDCRGLELQPVMSPVIENVNGTKIYGHKNLDIDRVIREGMADYSVDLENVGRAGENPLVVKAVSAKNFNSNPVLNIPDSNRVLIENYATKFLSDLKVVFLFD